MNVFLVINLFGSISISRDKEFWILTSLSLSFPRRCIVKLEIKSAILSMPAKTSVFLERGVKPLHIISLKSLKERNEQECDALRSFLTLQFILLISLNYQTTPYSFEFFLYQLTFACLRLQLHRINLFFALALPFQIVQNRRCLLLL